MKDIDMYEVIFQMMALDLLHNELIKQGYAINGSGVAIDMDEIKKAENMYTGEYIGVFDE